MPRSPWILVMTSTHGNNSSYTSVTHVLCPLGNRSLDIQLDGCYTRLFQRALNIDWSDHVTNDGLYGELPRLSNKLRSRRLQFAAKDEAVSKVILWIPTHGQRARGRPATTYVDLLSTDTGLQTEELATALTERCEWSDACFCDLRATH